MNQTSADFAKAPVLSAVIPLYNEEESLETLHKRLVQTLKSMQMPYEIIYVNDGSTDGTPELLENIAAQDPHVRIIEFSRNFGHQAALTAGIDHARGDVVVTLDGDGQHPPEWIPEMWEVLSRGFDIVQMKRIDSVDTSLFKRLTSRVFYKILRFLSDLPIEPGFADFRMMRRNVVHALRQMPEYHRFLRGMVHWLGFKTAIIEFKAEPRIGGHTKYPLRHMLDFAFDAIFSFSLTPIRLSIYLGIGFLILAFIEAVYVLSFWVKGEVHKLTPGWASLMFAILVVGGIIMIMLGIMGAYIGYIFQETKHRPVYVIRRIYPSPVDEHRSSIQPSGQYYKSRQKDSG